MQDPTLDRSFRGHKDIITDLCFKPSMTQLASGSMDNSVMVWNFKPQLRAFRFVGHKGPVTSVHYSPSGHLLASASRDKTVRLWTPNVKGDVTVFKAHTSAVRTVRFSHDGESMLTSSDDKTVKVWSTHRAKFQYTLAGHLNWVRSARFSPDDRVIVSGSDDKTVKLWDLGSKTCVKTYLDHSGMVSSVAFHPSGNLIASASTDKSIKLFDIRTHKLVQHYGDAHSGAGQSGPTTLDGPGTGGGPNSISFGGQGGEWLVSSGMDGLIKIWDLKEGYLFYTVHGHKNGPTTAAVFSPESDFFATGGSDSQVMVWRSNFETGMRLGVEDTGDSAPRKQRSSSQAWPSHSDHTNSASFVSRKKASMTPAIGRQRHDEYESESTTNWQPSGPEIVSVGTPLFLDQDHSPQSRGHSRKSTRSPLQPVSSSSRLAQHNHRGRGSSSEDDLEDFNYTTQIEMRTIPDSVTTTLQHLVSQVDFLTQTMTILEKRLTMSEDRGVDLSRQFEILMARLNGNSAALPASPNLRDEFSEPHPPVNARSPSPHHQSSFQPSSNMGFRPTTATSGTPDPSAITPGEYLRGNYSSHGVDPNSLMVGRSAGVTFKTPASAAISRPLSDRDSGIFGAGGISRPWDGPKPSATPLSAFSNTKG